MVLRAGELREKITVKRASRTQDENGDFVTTQNTVLTTFASVVEQRSNPSQVGSKEDVFSYQKIRIRYRSDIFLKNGDLLEWRGNVFTINNFIVDPLRRYIELLLISEIESSER